MSARRQERAAALVLLAAAAALMGPTGARSQSAVVTSLTLFAGSPAGLWRSGDWGGTWQKARSGAVHSLLPQGPRVVAGSDEGLLLSEDFGQSWRVVGLDTPVLSVLPSRYPLADPTVFAGTAKGLLKSPDGGLTFQPTVLSGTSVLRLEWPGPELVVATGRGVLISKDAGRTFRPPGEGFPPGEVRALAVSSYFVVDPVLFAGVAGAGVYRSSDRGRSWASAGLSEHTVNDLVWLGPILYAATDKGLFRSEDAGAHWMALGEGLSGRAGLCLMFPLAPASGAEFFLGTDAGVFRTADGGNHWMKAGLPDERILSLGTFPPPPPVTGKRKRN